MVLVIVVEGLISIGRLSVIRDIRDKLAITYLIIRYSGFTYNH